MKRSEQMSSLNWIKERFSRFYDELDMEMNRLPASDSTFSDFSMHSDDAKLLNRMEKGEISMKAVDDLIETAKEFDVELKSYIEKNNLRKKVARSKPVKPPRNVKSSFPPIWDEEQHNRSIDATIDEILKTRPYQDDFELDEDDVELPQKQSAVVVKPILKTGTSKTKKRDVSTSVKFQMHPQRVDRVAPQKQSNKKIQTTSQPRPQPHYKSDSSRGSIFPCRTESVVRDEVELDRGSKAPPKPKAREPPSAPPSLKYSPITLTSTAGRTRNAKRADDNDVVEIVNSSLATASKESAKQLTTFVQPVVSIKGACAIQKIYQLEVSPEQVATSIQFDVARENTKFVAFVYEATPKPILAPSPTSPKPSNEWRSNSAVTVESESHGVFFDACDVNKMLRDCGVRMRDGKIHVVVESGRSKRKSHKNPRKSFKSSALTKSVDELEAAQSEADNDTAEKINICTIDEAAPSAKAEAEINEQDSSMSSSITDDGKIRQILQISRGGERSSSESYQASSVSLVKPQVRVVERSVAGEFQEIYKLIDSTFQTANVGAEPTAETGGNEREIGDAMKEMRATIRESEESIRRAGMLLQKYQSKSVAEVVKPPTLQTEANESSNKIEKPAQAEKQIQTSNVHIEDYQTFSSGINVKQTADSSAQTAEDKNVQTDGTQASPQRYFGRVFDAYSNFKHVKFNQPPTTARHNPFSTSLDPCNCVGCENRRNLNQVVGLDSGKSPTALTPLSSVSASPKLSAPYNPIYSDDDEVMEAANKFLRSVERRKHRNADSDVTSTETSSSYSPQKAHSRKSSSSISTPSSELLNSIVPRDDRPVPRARNKLEQKLQEAAVADKPGGESLAGEARSINSSPDSPPFASSDWRKNQALLERYLSEGEVLSQGEIQLGLSDDDVLDDDF